MNAVIPIPYSPTLSLPIGVLSCASTRKSCMDLRIRRGRYDGRMANVCSFTPTWQSPICTPMQLASEWADDCGAARRLSHSWPVPAANYVRSASGLARSRTPGGTCSLARFLLGRKPPLRGPADAGFGLASNSPTRRFGCALLAVNAPPSGRPHAPLWNRCAPAGAAVCLKRSYAPDTSGPA